MHTYLESIGFRRIRSRRDMDKIVRDTVLHFDEKNIFRLDSKRIYGEFIKDFAPDMGICVCGEFDEDGNFHPEYSFPYYYGSTVSMVQEVDFEKHAGEESYAGACDDPRIGGTLIFYLTNMGKMKNSERLGINLLDKKPIRFSALAREGTVLLPVQKSAEDEEVHHKQQHHYFELLKEARMGDERAIEEIATEDLKNFNIIAQRLQKEDLFSVIDSSFSPYGIECDQYSVVGNITACEKVKNFYTEEWVWQMQIEACDVYFDLCINEERLQGEPKAGYRFEGLIWLQGNVTFEL